MMPVCVPDMSCLIHPERIDRLDLLRMLYDDIRIPLAVLDEYGEAPTGVDVVEIPTRLWCACSAEPSMPAKQR